MGSLSSDSNDNDIVFESSIATESNINLSSSISDTDSFIRRLHTSFSDHAELQSVYNSSDNAQDNYMQRCISNSLTRSSNPAALSNTTSNCNQNVKLNSEGQVNDIYIDDTESVSENMEIGRISHEHGDYFDESSDEEDFINITVDINEPAKRKKIKLDEIINDKDSNDCINSHVNISKIEIMLAVMTFCTQYHVPTKGIIDLFKMLNMFLNKDIFPDNYYQIHSIFSPKGCKEYHAICSLCQVYLGTFTKQQRTIFCEACDKYINLKDPSYSNYFVLLDVESELRCHIESNKDFYSEIVSRRNKEFNYENGFEVQLHNETRKLYVYALCCCVDSVARAPMQGLVQFNGYYGCNWCLHPGSLIRHDTGYSMKYPILDEFPERRTADATFILMQRSVESNTPQFGVKNVSPLLLLYPFNIIDGFVPCSLHCVDRGLGNQFTNYWLNSSNKPYSIPKNKIKDIDQLLNNIKVPTQLTRLSRSLRDRAYWKAIEWRNWILYYSVPVLKYISEEIPAFEEYMNHWSLLVEAYYILLQTKITVMELQRADLLLKDFVYTTEKLYTVDAMTYNVHQLLHLAQSVADWGPLYAHSGYVFESGNGRIKKTIYAANGVLSQVCRYLSFDESIRKIRKHIEKKKKSPCLEYVRYLDNNVTQNSVKFAYRYFGRTKVNEDIVRQLQLPVEKVRAYKKMVKNGCPFKSSEKVLYRSDNSFASLKNGDYIEIQQFLVNMENGQEYVTYKKIEVIGDDVISNELHCTKQVIGINQNIEMTFTENIDKTCVYLKFDSNDYISSVCNMYWN
ncbi:uncharacterized protein LOC131670810 [Phymastichus coffea]|uniref:uncharacterized protein LOC131670810 n=1 Tax=Phymastichus coffea TaxID=108790 RepID=UPI00273C0054|nr:uncharacterized protein LOC131670810 [Phymastichus coffea]